MSCSAYSCFVGRDCLSTTVVFPMAPSAGLAGVETPAYQRLGAALSRPSLQRSSAPALRECTATPCAVRLGEGWGFFVAGVIRHAPFLPAGR